MSGRTDHAPDDDGSYDSEESDHDYVPSDDDANDEEETKSPTNNKRRSKDRLPEVTPNEKDTDTPFFGDSVNKGEDDIWAEFLSEQQNSDAAQSVPSTSDYTGRCQPEKRPVTVEQTYDFAGEEVKIRKTIDTDLESPETESVAGNSKLPVAPKRSASGQLQAPRKPGLAGALGVIKKQKLSTLEKSKLDWSNFKSDEGISEELTTFNRGKEGYLDRQDFLSRSDHRRFEVERRIRQKTNRKT